MNLKRTQENTRDNKYSEFEKEKFSLSLEIDSCRLFLYSTYIMYSDLTRMFYSYINPFNVWRSLELCNGLIARLADRCKCALF